ncbi:MAG: IclR family transcriptional regulator [Hyphomicrobiaceae bacterium]|nr:IclR family transcriptional regulator [Hyphomicrobiaceae bacterium]
MVTRTSGTVEKALDILDELSGPVAERGVSELAVVTGINKSTVVRLCATLAQRGYLQRGQRQRYRLGPRVANLARAYRQGFDLEAEVRPILRELRDASGESASFYVRRGGQRICLYRESSRHPIRHHVDEGAQLPLGVGVVGRVLLAFSGEPGQDLEQIRSAGYHDAAGREPLTASVSVPVLCDGALVGALVLSGPSNRFTARAREAALALLEKGAGDLGMRLLDNTKCDDRRAG